MQDLTPVRLTGGGTMLVLVDADGGEYVVPVDSRLRETLGQAMFERERPRDKPGFDPIGIRTKEPIMESTLRPRDIQARVRAGESPEDVAAVAGTSVERVMIFASPVLAERAHVADGAQACSVRRRSAEPSSTVRTLGAAAATRLREEGVDPESVEWDAWRRDDGRWTLVAGYHHDGERRRATFGLDQPGRFVTAEDDEGRWLVGDGSFPSRAEKAAAAQRRLTPVPRYDEELPIGDDAIELVREDASDTSDLNANALLRAHRPVPVPEPDAVTGDADWIAPQHPHSSHGRETVLRDAAVDEPPAAMSSPRPVFGDPELLPGIDPASPVDTDELSGEESVDEPDEPRQVQPRKARGRSSVPSWDEIMFGGGRGD